LQRTTKQINTKRLFQIKTVHKAGGFAPLGNTNLRGYLNNWRSYRKNSVSKLLMLSKPENAMEMILNGGKEKFTINSKDLGVARDYKIDFEGISHFIKKNQ
jgi:excinuclease ABC subunit A